MKNLQQSSNKAAVSPYRLLLVFLLVLLGLMGAQPGNSAQESDKRRAIRPDRREHLSIEKKSFIEGNSDKPRFQDAVTLAPGLPDIETAMAGENIYVLYGPMGMNEDLYLRASHNAGVSFDEPILVRPTIERSWAQRLAAVGEHVYVAWVEGRHSNTQINFARSTNGGRDFGPRSNLGANPGHKALAPLIAAYGDTVYVLWKESDDASGIGEAHRLRVSHDRGFTFGEAMHFGSSTDRFSPGENYEILVADVYGVHLILDGSKYFRSSDGGRTFSDIKYLGGDSVAVTGEQVFVASRKLTAEGTGPGTVVETNNVWLNVSTDRGASFVRKNVPKEVSGAPHTVTVWANGDHVFVAWEQVVGGFWSAFLGVSHDAGASFAPIVSLGEEGKNCHIPNLATADRHVYLSWRCIGETLDPSTGSPHYSSIDKWLVSGDYGRSFDGPMTMSGLGGALAGTIHSILMNENSIHIFGKTAFDFNYVRGVFGSSSPPLSPMLNKGPKRAYQ